MGAVAALLGACAHTPTLIPDGYKGPTATLSDSINAPKDAECGGSATHCRHGFCEAN